MTAVSFRTNDERLPGLISRVGNSAISYENFVMRLATMLTRNVPESNIRQYNGGSWCLEQVECGEYGTVFWWRLEDESEYQYSSPYNGADEKVDAELLSMSVCLMATSDLCNSNHAQALDAEKHVPRNQQWLDHLNGLAEAYHDIFHGLRGHFFDRLQDDEKRSGALFRMTD